MIAPLLIKWEQMEAEMAACFPEARYYLAR
jgi:hypothetical protein